MSYQSHSRAGSYCSCSKFKQFFRFEKARSNSLESVASNPKRTRALIYENTDKPKLVSSVSIRSSFSIPNQLDISIDVATLKDYRRVAKHY